VEIGLLLDTHTQLGLAGLAQVNLGVREHRNRPLAELGRMASQVLAAALARCEIVAEGAALTQFVQVDAEWVPDTSTVSAADRPPMRDLARRRAAVAALPTAAVTGQASRALGWVPDRAPAVGAGGVRAPRLRRRA